MKPKQYISLWLKDYCDTNGHDLWTEYQFLDDRKFRFDWCILNINIGIEYEGINSKKSRHTNIKGYTKDCEKYNLAQMAGYKVLRFTALNYKTINEYLK